MKNSLFRIFYFITLNILFLSNLYSQKLDSPLNGIWAGNLPLPEENQILMFLNIKNSEFLLSVPAQEVEKMKMDKKEISNNEFELSIFDILMKCKYQDNSIYVNYEQNNFSESFVLTKISDDSDNIVREQGKREKDINVQLFNIENDKFKIEAEHININKNSPTFIILEGTNITDNQNTYNQGFYGHNLSLAISNYLAKNRFNTIRIINVENKKTMPYSIHQKIQHYKMLVDYFKEKNKGNYILLGHSEGGIVADLLADDSRLLGKVILSAPVESITNSILFQTNNRLQFADFPQDYKSTLANMNTDFFNQVKLLDLSKSPELLSKELKENFKDYKYYNVSEHNYNIIMEEYSNMLQSPFYISCFKTDLELKEVLIKKPTLFIYGDKDYLVNSKTNIEYLKSLNSPKISVKEFNSMSHSLQRCEDCTLDEAFFLQETINAEVLKYIIDWVKNIK